MYGPPFSPLFHSNLYNVIGEPLSDGAWKKNDNDKVSFQLVWWHETRQWTFFFKVRLSHFPYFSVCYQFLEWVGAKLKLRFSVVLFNLNFSRQVGRQMKNFLVNQNAVQRTVIFDFWQLTTFYKREHAALYLTALMELHVFHLKITFNDYIITPLTLETMGKRLTVLCETKRNEMVLCETVRNGTLRNVTPCKVIRNSESR